MHESQCNLDEVALAQLLAERLLQPRVLPQALEQLGSGTLIPSKMSRKDVTAVMRLERLKDRLSTICIKNFALAATDIRAMGQNSICSLLLGACNRIETRPLLPLSGSAYATHWFL